MALLNDEAKAELPDDVVAEVETAEAGGGGETEEPKTEVIRLSRRKREQEERDARMAALEARAAEADQIRAELGRQREESAATRARLEEMQRNQEMQWRQQQSPREPVDNESIAQKIAKERKLAQQALGKSDLDEYHERMEAIMNLTVRANLPPPPQQFAPPPQKPDWVRAIEFQYPDVMTHPKGQQTAAYLESLIDGPFGPDKLHAMFTRARADLGIARAAPAAAAASNPSQRQQLYQGISSTGQAPRKAGDLGAVNIPKQYLATAARMGMTRAQAAKAWAESYPEDREG